MVKVIAVSIVIPAFNEETCIGNVVKQVSQALSAYAHEILVIDDGSTDLTRERAEEAGARVHSHRRNRGYGASLKTGIRHAAHEWILIMDSDGQHRSEDVLRLLETLSSSEADMVVGARNKDSYQYAARMPGKKLLQRMAEYLTGERPPDINSGLRLFRKSDSLPLFPILPNGFSFTTTLTLALSKDGYEIVWAPIQVENRQGRASTVRIRDGINTLLLIVRIAALFNPLKVFVPISLILFSMGMVYGVWNVIREFNIPDGAGLLMLAGIIVFFFGILADQLASIRRGG